MLKRQSEKYLPRLARVAILGAISVLCVASPLANANIVTNGGFETGNTNGWTLSPGGPFDFVCTPGQQAGAAACSVHGGSYAMTFGLSGALDTLSQTLVTNAGATYGLSFWLANDNPGGGSTEEFDVLWNGSAVLNIGPGAVGGFAYGLNTFSVTGTGQDTLSFVARHDPSQWFLDDVTVNAVPEPSSLAIFGLALAGLRLSARRKKAES